MSDTGSEPYAFRARCSRRSIIAAAFSGLSLHRFPSLTARAATPGTWRTWLLASPDELRPARPEETSHAEIGELLDFRDRRTVQAFELIERWNVGAAGIPWANLALDLIQLHRPSPVHAGRALALLHAAISDAAVAALDAQNAYRRAAPAALEPEVEPVVSGGDYSFPSETAAVAGAAGVILPYLFPSEPPEMFAAMVDEATSSRMWAGANVRSDIDAGLDLGCAIGQLGIDRGKTDGADMEWDGGERPTGEGKWEPTPPKYAQEPLTPLAGMWQPWVLASGSDIRPAPPPEYGSPMWQSELRAVQDAVANRTDEQVEAVHFWAGGPGTVTPAGLWVEIARDLILRDGLASPHAERILALTSVAIADAFICCWDAKYTYWMARPITADPTLDVLIPTPPFPSYTSGHSTISAAAATVLGHLFPEDATILTAQAEEAKASRLWAGIHFPIDNDMGAAGGAQIGRLVASIASAEGVD
jgi:membrane-associated phospholipid phosphatase